jgi:hypothetical protein
VPSGAIRLGAAVLAALVVGTALLVSWAPSRADWAPTNREWNGLASFREGLRVADADGRAPVGGQDVLVVVPRRSPGPDAVAAVRSHLAGGGTVWLLDDFGAGNDYLEGLGLAARFAGVPLRDPIVNAGAPELVQATWRAPGGPERVLVLLRGVEGLDVLATAGRFAAGEGAGPRPAVAARTALGGGTLVMIADPSTILNGTLVLGDNGVIFRELAEGRRVAIYTPSLPGDRLSAAKLAVASLHAIAAHPFALGFWAVAAALLVLWPFDGSAVRGSTKLVGSPPMERR